MNDALLILLGAVITTGFNWFIENRKRKKDDELYLKRRREEIYTKCYTFLMASDCHFNNFRLERKLTRDLSIMYNEIQAIMIFSSLKISELFYYTVREIKDNIKNNDFDEAYVLNHKKVLEFLGEIRKEMGIKD